MNTEYSCDLAAKTCKPCEGGVPPMEQAEIERMLEALNEWEHADAGERVDCFVTLASKKPCKPLEKHIPDN